MKTVTLPSGKKIPALGQGTWQMGRNRHTKAEEIAALRRGVELGMSLIDTAELYDDAESLIGEGLNDLREKIYLVSKVMPSNASKKGTIEACERSLKKLKTDRLDMYLLHWRSSFPVKETLEAFQLLKDSGKILDFGVSNFDVSDMEEAMRLNDGIATNQVLYNLNHRGIEFDLLPWCKKHKMPIMGYTPFQLGELANHSVLEKIAKRHQASAVQIALAWVLRGDYAHVMTIPKAANVKHVEENFGALKIKLTSEDLEELDREFPPPKHRVSLEAI